MTYHYLKCLIPSSNIRIFLFLYIGFIILVYHSCAVTNKHLTTIDNNKAALGKLLFADKSVSYNGKIACNTCHASDKAFSDGYKLSINSEGEPLPLNSPSLLNLNNYKFFSQVDSTVISLFDQMNRPLFGHNPVEIGLDRDSSRIFRNLSVKYEYLIKKIYPNGQHLNITTFKDCIASYLKTLENRNSVWDSIQIGKKMNVNVEPIMKGYGIFKKYDCQSCHNGEDFNEPSANINHYHIDISGRKLRIAGLRNLKYTKPYLSDGSAGTIQDVLQSHISNNWVKNIGHGIDDGEKLQLIKFLYSLSGDLTKFN